MARRVLVSPAATPQVNVSVAMPKNSDSAPPTNGNAEDTRPDFWGYIHQLSEDDWKKHIIYLTREVPKTSINGVGGYLTKLTQPFDIEDIKLAYGGYEFSYILKEGQDICKKCRNATGRFRIEAPPKYDPSRENSSAPAVAPAGGNADVLKQFADTTVSILREELQRSRETQGSGAGTEQIIEMMAKASDRAMEVVTKQAPQSGDPSAQVTSLLAAAEKLAALRAPAQKSLVEQILELIGHPIIGPKILELFVPKNPLDELAKLGSLMDIVEKLRGSGDGSDAKDWKAMGIKMLGDKLPEILDTLNRNADQNAAIAAARARAGQMPPQAHQPQPQSVQPAAAPRPQPQPASPVAPSPVAAPAVHVEGGLRTVARSTTPVNAEVIEMPPQPDQTINHGSVNGDMNTDQLLTSIKIQVVNMMRTGSTGASIASYLEDVRPDVADDLVKYSPEIVKQYFLRDPILKLMVDDPRWEEVIADAREYLNDEEPESSVVN